MLYVLVEARDGVVTIHDAPYDAIRAIVSACRVVCIPRAQVEYVYTPDLGVDEARVDDMENREQALAFDLHAAIDTNTQQILAIADKYAVLPLKLRCERVLARRLNHLNVCEFLLFGDTYS